MTSRFGEFRVEYGAGPADATGCTGAITWGSTPTAATNHVRVFLQNKAGVNALLQRTSITTAFTVLDNPVGTLIPTNVSYTQAAGAQTYAFMTDPARTWVRSAYDPATNLDDRPGLEGRSGDRLTMVDIMGRVSKTVQVSPTNTAQVSTDTWVPSTQLWAQEVGTLPVYGPGSTFSYTITPTLTANPMPPAGTLRDVLVEDCLPVSVVFASADLNPNYSGSDRTPYVRQITCKPGEFYLGWYWPKRDVTQQLPPITLTVRVLEMAPSGERVNNALITTESDLSSLDQRRDYARITIQAPDGVRVAKAALTPIVYVDGNGWVSTPNVEWRIVARNLNAGVQVSDVDIIDWLPEQRHQRLRLRRQW